MPLCDFTQNEVDKAFCPQLIPSLRGWHRVSCHLVNLSMLHAMHQTIDGLHIYTEQISSQLATSRHKCTRSQLEGTVKDLSKKDIYSRKFEHEAGGLDPPK